MLKKIRAQFVALSVGCAMSQLCTVGAGQGTTSSAPATDPAFIESFKQLPIEEQSARLTASAESGMLIAGLDTPDEFALLASDKALEYRINLLSEPLNEEWLDALESLLQRNVSGTAQVRAAVLLFRHSRASGRTFLLSKLQQESDTQVAHVFAVAQEPGTEDAVVDAFVHSIVNGRDVPSGLAPALIAWRSQRLNELLLEPQIQGQFASRGRDLLHARLIATSDGAGNEAARNEAKEKLRRSFEDAGRTTTWRSVRAADVLRCDPNDEDSRAFLLQQLDVSPTEAVFRAIAETGDAAFVDAVAAALDRSLLPAGEETRDERIKRLHIGLYALEAIARLGGALPVPQTIALHASSWQPADSLKRLELIMIRSGNEALLGAVRERIGEEEVTRIQALQALKPVPDWLPRYVPGSSRGWLWQ